MNAVVEARSGRRSWRPGLAALWVRARYPLAIYVASRLLYLLVAVIDSVAQHKGLHSELSNWDGHWYLQTAEHGYPHAVAPYTQPRHYSTLGFLPLYPGLMWLLAHTVQLSPFSAGLLLSLVFGFTATLLVTRLAEQWWGAAAARRTLIFWCFFPGTVVFSMVYTEALTITLIAGCLLALGSRRWARAGLLAGLATATSPVAVAAIPACAVAAWLEIRRRDTTHAGWLATLRRDRAARRSLLAPLLSPVGLIAFGIFLWFWCGTPLASYQAQHGAWEESTTPLAIPYVFGSLMHEIFIGPSKYGPGGINLNLILALLGTFFLFYGLWRLWRVRHTLPLTVWTWTVFAALLALTSAKTPPNPRMLICTFPVVLIVGAQTEGKRGRWILAANVFCLVALTWFTYVGTWLRP